MRPYENKTNRSTKTGTLWFCRPIPSGAMKVERWTKDASWVWHNANLIQTPPSELNWLGTGISATFIHASASNPSSDSL